MTIDIHKSLLQQYGQYMSLNIFIDLSNNSQLTSLYQNAINVHNEKLHTDFIDAGFDLYVPIRLVSLTRDTEDISSACSTSWLKRKYSIMKS